MEIKMRESGLSQRKDQSRNRYHLTDTPALMHTRNMHAFSLSYTPTVKQG